MQFSEQTKTMWKAVSPDLTKENHGLVVTVNNRGEAQVIRLAVIYALLDGQGAIEPVHLQAALAV